MVDKESLVLSERRKLVVQLDELAERIRVYSSCDSSDGDTVRQAAELIARQQAEIHDMRSGDGENRVVPVARRSLRDLPLAEFVAKPKGLKALINAKIFPRALGGNHPVNLAAAVADGDGEFTGATTPAFGVFLGDCGYLFVKGERCYAVNDLVEHGRLVDEDRVVLQYLFKYLSKSIEVAA